MNSTTKNLVIFLLKAPVTAACLWWLARFFDFEQISAALAGIDVRLLVVAIALHFLSFVAGGVRWWLLFRHLNGAIAFRQVWPSYYLGVFFNNLLPSIFGGFLRARRVCTQLDLGTAPWSAQRSLTACSVRRRWSAWVFSRCCSLRQGLKT